MSSLECPSKSYSKSSIVKYGYSIIKKKLNESKIYTEDEFREKCKLIDITRYTGKSGNRKLIRDDIRFYKSLFIYTEFLKKYIARDKIPFVLRLKIAKNNLKLEDHMLCRCKSRTTFCVQTQEFTKLFCGKCAISYWSKQWFIYKYGDVVGLQKYKEFKFSPEMINKSKAAGRNSFLKRKGNLFIGCLARGKNETQLLNFIEKIDGVCIKRCVPICGYYCDGYCEETNTVYEVYEKYHAASPAQITYDTNRQQEIMNTKKCNFVIIYDLDIEPTGIDNLTIKRLVYDKD